MAFRVVRVPVYGAYLDEAIALQGLGEAHLGDGRLEDGAARLHEALEIYRRLGMPAAGQVTARLAEIGAPRR